MPPSRSLLSPGQTARGSNGIFRAPGSFATAKEATASDMRTRVDPAGRPGGFPICEAQLLSVSQRLTCCGRQKDVAEVRSWLLESKRLAGGRGSKRYKQVATSVLSRGSCGIFSRSLRANAP